ncbi:MAG: hypothetical protein HDKAJFGB_00373 [Anaerolineae bacterium]|nr:hypothetical protein [Anaerolineae bacterium]RIK32869.1 MAG: hypothetical protein DCC52_04560 [Chloroflexota bacterium]
MKKLVLMLAVGALLLTAAPFALPARAAPMFDDPQLCINGKLFMAVPTTDAIDVFMEVGSNVTLDYNVVNCGGDPNLPVVDPAQVTVGGKKNVVTVRVQTAPKAKVLLSYDGKSKHFKADKYGWVEVSRKVH